MLIKKPLYYGKSTQPPYAKTTTPLSSAIGSAALTPGQQLIAPTKATTEVEAHQFNHRLWNFNTYAPLNSGAICSAPYRVSETIGSHSERAATHLQSVVFT